ncbi:molybdenum cofactor guanylyltransferase [uncultured Sphingomonas sp.]|uniref:molybdenum cofactor guanylyltransferase n=1 Tax=uncultured Sphingomonas sp. TaxID=158754 RepID=UPI0035CB5936
MGITGAVLAGGRSQRFGSDKALAELDGRTLIDHAAAIVAPFADAVIVCGRRRAPSGLIAVDDLPRAHLGPLGGLCAALAYAARRGHDFVLSTGCDTPVIDRGLLVRLLAGGTSTYVAEAPIIGLWSTALAGTLLHHLETCDDRSIRRWADAAGISVAAAGQDIPNLNRPLDLAMLRRTFDD